MRTMGFKVCGVLQVSSLSLRLPSGVAERENSAVRPLWCVVRKKSGKGVSLGSLLRSGSEGFVQVGRGARDALSILPRVSQCALPDSVSRQGAFFIPCLYVVHALTCSVSHGDGRAPTRVGEASLELRGFPNTRKASGLMGSALVHQTLCSTDPEDSD